MGTSTGARRSRARKKGLKISPEMIRVRPRLIGGQRPGVLVWWSKPPYYKKPVLMAEIEDLILIRPDLSWPREVDPRKHESWGGLDSIRVTYHEWLCRPIYVVAERVPHLAPLFEIPRGAWIKTEYKRGPCRFDTGKEVAYAIYHSVNRATLAIPNLEWRLHPSARREGMRILGGFVGKNLRAVMVPGVVSG